MEHSTLAALSAWTNFYVIVGSAAGALTGLQFVVMSLLATEHSGGSAREIRAFGTPTVVLFCAALLISAGMNVPWHSASHFGIFVGACGVAGLWYALATIWHARKADYKPDREDWFWYIALPLASYAGLLAAAILFWGDPASSLDAIATIALFCYLPVFTTRGTPLPSSRSRSGTRRRKRREAKRWPRRLRAAHPV